MQARLTVYPVDSAAIVRWLRPDDVLRIGRGDDCDLRIEHPSVSRVHAELRPQTDGWRLRDLGSKNGSHVDGETASERLLSHPCWLRFGDIHCEFAPLTAAEVAAGESSLRTRRAAATAHTARLDGIQRLDDLLDASLRGVLELAQCERGFVLLEQDDDFVVRASLALDASNFVAHAFSGSVGAVRRALQERRSVVANDIGREAWLSSRESVIAAGLSALVCLPLLDGAHTLGAVYADRVSPGPPINTLDVELLEAFAERAALWIAARRGSELLERQAAEAPVSGTHGWNGPEWSRIVAAHAGDLP